jgi:hypothetical protein
MPNLEGATPGGYDDAAASSLEQGMSSDSEGKAFYDAFSQSRFANQYNPVGYDEIVGDPESPVALTSIPTSSTNVRRPRTVAAGYDPERKVMTVMFRDGTLFNYYNVEPGTWKLFDNSYSKGPLLNLYNKGQYDPGVLLVTPHQYGPADISNVSSDVLSTIYKVARASQFRYASNKGTVYRTAQGKAYTPPKAKKGRPPKNTPPAAKAHKPHRP